MLKKQPFLASVRKILEIIDDIRVLDINDNWIVPYDRLIEKIEEYDNAEEERIIKGLKEQTKEDILRIKKERKETEKLLCKSKKKSTTKQI